MSSSRFIRHLLVLAACIDVPAQAGLIAQTEKVDGVQVLVYDDPCPGDASGQLRWVVRRTAGAIEEGCWVKNNRGNLVVKWPKSGLIQEIDGNSFRKPGTTVLQELKVPNEPKPRESAANARYQVPDSVFLSASSRAFDTLTSGGQQGMKREVRSCFAKLSFDSTASKIAACVSFDLTAAWIDEGVSKAMGAPPDPELKESRSFERAANALRMIGVESEPEVQKVLQAWKPKISAAFRKASGKSLLQQ